MNASRPICHVVAGPNGSGKSTFALRYLPRWAGAVEYVKVARVTNLTRTLEELKKQNIWIYAVTMEGEDFRKASYREGTALVIGAEGEGISRLTLEHCDLKVSLPMRGHLDSLNAASAASVVMYQVLASRES